MEEEKEDEDNDNQDKVRRKTTMLILRRFIDDKDDGVKNEQVEDKNEYDGDIAFAICVIFIFLVIINMIIIIYHFNC